MTIRELLAGKGLCVCVGPGGVGKTTTAAALGLGMAARGKKVAVVTIDPARRLADALGLDELDNEPRQVPAERLAGKQLDGELWAMTLDPKRTFDELIDEVASDPEQARNIKGNRIYREISGAVAGSQEFTAVSKVYELDRSGQFDLLVLDTPPARNALDFLDAPERLTSFLEGHALQMLLAPTGFGARLLAPVFGLLQRVTGVDVITDLTVFFHLLGNMTTEFNARAHAVDRLLHSQHTAFVIVTRAAPDPIDETLALHRALHQRELPFAATILNRYNAAVGDLTAEPETTDGDPGTSSASGPTAGTESAALLEAQLGPALAARVAASVADHNSLAARDRAQLERLTAALDSEPLALVPQLDDDVHDASGLLQICEQLFAQS
jgi:anion-transporting  ArsA/GET3 family ATPase